jgi:hypothetical protein
MHIYGSAAKKLNEMGYITTKENAKLGYLCSDIKNEGVIIHEINEAPKTYMYSYIDNTNTVKYNDTAKLVCKGIPKEDKSRALYDENNKIKLDKDGKIMYTKLLNYEMYVDDDRKTTLLDENEQPVINKKTGEVVLTSKDNYVVSFGGLKRKHKSLTNADVENGVNHFSIVNSHQTRTFMNTSWKGMIFHENQWYPHGYEFN